MAYEISEGAAAGALFLSDTMLNSMKVGVDQEKIMPVMTQIHKNLKKVEMGNSASRYLTWFDPKRVEKKEFDKDKAAKLTAVVQGCSAALGIRKFMKAEGDNWTNTGVKVYLTGIPLVFPLVSATTLSLDTWYHIAFTRSGNDNVLYINGSSDISVTSSGSVGTSTDESVIGTYVPQPTNYPFAGNIDEVSLYDYALTSGNITTIYNSGTPTDLSTLSTPPVAWWKIGEEATFSTNWTVPDQIGSIDGTSANMTIEDRQGNSPNSDTNALSYNMDAADVDTDVPS